LCVCRIRGEVTGIASPLIYNFTEHTSGPLPLKPRPSPLPSPRQSLWRGEGRGEGEFYLFLICLYPFESKVLELLKFQYLKICNLSRNTVKQIGIIQNNVNFSCHPTRGNNKNNPPRIIKNPKKSKITPAFIIFVIGT